MREIGRRLLTAGLLALFLVALAGFHTHALAAGSQDGACLACALATAHEGAAGPVIVPLTGSVPGVVPSAEAPVARPSLPDLTGRSPPRLPAA
jgi:hypothetical protein